MVARGHARYDTAPLVDLVEKVLRSELGARLGAVWTSRRNTSPSRPHRRTHPLWLMTAEPSLESARQGYAELVRLLTSKGRRNKWAGIALGDPEHDLLLGLTLDNAAPLFVNPWALPNRILMVLGDEGAGKSFLARLLQLRAGRVRPKAVLDVADDGPARWPGAMEKPPRAVVSVAPTVGGFPGLRGAPVTNVAFQGLLLRTTPDQSIPPGGTSPFASGHPWLVR